MAPKILIVEDDKFLRQAYSNILSKEKFEVKIAVNGREGLEAALTWQPNLVLLDLLMPEMDGIAFLRAFNAPSHPEIKILVFSNLSMPEKVNEAIILGAVNFKTKAMFTPREMIALIRDTISEPVATATTPTREPPAVSETTTKQPPQSIN